MLGCCCLCTSVPWATQGDSDCHQQPGGHVQVGQSWSWACSAGYALAQPRRPCARDTRSDPCCCVESVVTDNGSKHLMSPPHHGRLDVINRHDADHESALLSQLGCCQPLPTGWRGCVRVSDRGWQAGRRGHSCPRAGTWSLPLLPASGDPRPLEKRSVRSICHC